MPAVYEAEIELYTDFIKESHLSQKWHMHQIYISPLRYITNFILEDF
jgi:hypothetical protein